jgi:hypothetical protein
MRSPRLRRRSYAVYPFAVAISSRLRPHQRSQRTSTLQRVFMDEAEVQLRHEFNTAEAQELWNDPVGEQPSPMQRAPGQGVLDALTE